MLVFLLGSAMAQPQQPKEEPAATPAAWHNLVDEFFNSWFKFRPTNGTSAGLHQYDEQMEDYTRTSLDAEVAALTDFEKRFAGLDPKNEPVGIGVDRDLVINKIRGRLLETERTVTAESASFSSRFCNTWAVKANCPASNPQSFWRAPATTILQRQSWMIETPNSLWLTRETTVRFEKQIFPLRCPLRYLAFWHYPWLLLAWLLVPPGSTPPAYRPNSHSHVLEHRASWPAQP